SSANAGFEVPQQNIERAVEYVRRCFREQQNTFTYKITERDHTSRAMAGAGILALAHAGFHHSPEAQQAGDWLLQHDFTQYNQGYINTRNDSDRYHYGLWTCSQAMYQLGGEHWKKYFPATAQTILAN